MKEQGELIERIVVPKYMRILVEQLRQQRGRLVQIETDYVLGLPERRLADDLLDALDAYERAEAAADAAVAAEEKP